MPGDGSGPGDGIAASTARIRSWRARFWGSLRVVALLCAILLLALTVWLRSAEARAGEALLGFGAELFEWQDAHFHTKPRRLTVNGLEFRLVTASTALSVVEVLDRVEDMCRKKSGVAMPAGAKAALPATLLEGIVRRQAAREGVIACIDTNGPLDVLDVAPRIERFAATGDLGELGELRYFMVRRNGNTTTVIAFWTEGSAPILKMFPKTGDAPGHDPEGVPRPENLRRLMSAAEHGAPYSVTLYRADDWTPDALVERYLGALRQGGWSVDRTGGAHSVLARKGTRTIAIRANRTKAGQTVASVTELS